MQCQPVVAHGVLYATSPKLRVFALNAATGAELVELRYESGHEVIDANPHPRADVPRTGGRQTHLFRLATLAICPRCEDRQAASRIRSRGRIDLRNGFEGRDPVTLSVGVNTPGVFYAIS